MKRFFAFIGCVTIATVLASTRAAVAAAPTVDKIADYYGSCPATVHFSGALYPPTAAPTKITYVFGYYDPGQAKWIADKAKTISVNGSVGVTDTGTFTGSGVATVVLYQNNVVSPQPQSFQVHCGAVPPRNPGIRGRLAGNYRFPVWSSMPFQAWDWRLNQYTYSGGLGSLPDFGTACGDICAGFRHFTSGGGAPFGYHEIDDWRSYMQFGKIPNPPKPVSQAVLILTLDVWSSQSSLKCLEGVAPALSTWQGNKAWVNGNFTYNAPTIASGLLLPPDTRKVMFDVTSIVRDWFSGKIANHGFVIAGSNEAGTEPPDNVDCVIGFAVSPTLLVR